MGQKHKFKSSRGLLYCKYCGVHPSNKIGWDNECCFFGSNPQPHNYISTKSDGKTWEIRCSNCGDTPDSMDMGC